MSASPPSSPLSFNSHHHSCRWPHNHLLHHHDDDAADHAGVAHPLSGQPLLCLHVPPQRGRGHQVQEQKPDRSLLVTYYCWTSQQCEVWPQSSDCFNLFSMFNMQRRTPTIYVCQRVIVSQWWPILVFRTVFLAIIFLEIHGIWHIYPQQYPCQESLVWNWFETQTLKSRGAKWS